MVEEPDKVSVYWTSSPVAGAAFCLGNPFVDRTVTLEEPLGDRGLYDGSVYPPRAVVPPAVNDPHLEQAPLDALTLTLTLEPEQPDGMVRSRLTVENRSGDTVRDPRCATSNYSYGVVAVDEPDAPLDGGFSMTRCVGPRDLPPGYSETGRGPVFKLGDLPPGDYLASMDFGDARSRRLTAVLHVR